MWEKKPTNNSIDRNDGKGKLWPRNLWPTGIWFDTSGCTIPWAVRKGSTVFKCKGCTEVARLVGEVEDLRKMMESLKRMVTGQGLEETIGETGDLEATLEEAWKRRHEIAVPQKKVKGRR